MNRPQVSVLMTAYNREDFLEEAMRSVLESTFQDFELIVVDDASSDRTYEIAKEVAKTDERVQVVRNEKNLGQFGNRDYAASLAKGQYLKYLDSDDIIYPHGLGLMVRAMETYPEAGLGLASNTIDEMQPFPIFSNPRQAYFKHFLQQGYMTCGPSGSLIRTDVFKAVGGYGSKCYVGSDVLLWLKISALYPVVKFQPALIWWRQHEGQAIIEGHRTNDYINNDFPAIRKVLLSDCNPLSCEEKREALRLLKKRQIVTLTKLFFKGDVRLAVSVFRRSKLTVYDFFNSIRSNAYKKISNEFGE